MFFIERNSQTRKLFILGFAFSLLVLKNSLGHQSLSFTDKCPFTAITLLELVRDIFYWNRICFQPSLIKGNV